MKILSVLFAACLCILLVDPSSSQTAEVKTAPAEQKFKHIFVVVLENQEFWVANLNTHLSGLAKKGTLLTNHEAATHPSQPNYIAMLAGDTMGVKSNNDRDVDGRNLVDLLDEKQISWKSYQEEYPGNCFSGSSHKGYRRKHNPFISFNNIRDNPDRCSKIVNADELFSDLEAKVLPQFMFYTPNMHNNGHDTSIMTSGKWVSEFVHKLLEHPAFKQDTLIVVTFDEGLYLSANKVFTILIGSGVPENIMDNTRYTHYSLLRTVENNFGLGTLGRKDQKANHFLYKNEPPAFLITAPILAIVCVGIAVTIVTVITLSVVLVRRRRRSVQKSVDENGSKFSELDETESAKSIDVSSV